jgi:IS1 family transposase
VDNKGNKQWVWLALDANTREIGGVYIGARDEPAARKLWQSLPPVYANVRSPTPTFGQRMQQFYRARVTERWVKRLEKPAILSDSTTH